MSVFHSREMNVAICKALGVDASRVSKITIIIEGGHSPDIQVKLLPSDESMQFIADALANPGRE